MFTIENNVSNEIIINKSRFICYLFKVDNLYDVKKYIEEIKLEYKDATHYCYSYIIGNVKKAFDDKEPSHTAGLPMLNVLENKKLDNILAIVVRYFGGIKLGAGGLVRAYTEAVTKCLDKTKIIRNIKLLSKKIKFKYEDINTINYLLKDYKITYKEYDSDVIYEFIYEENNYPDGIDKYLIK